MILQSPRTFEASILFRYAFGVSSLGLLNGCQDPEVAGSGKASYLPLCWANQDLCSDRTEGQHRGHDYVKGFVAWPHYKLQQSAYETVLHSRLSVIDPCSKQLVKDPWSPRA